MSDDGATPKELLFESCRRNNTALLNDLLSQPPLSSDASKIASFLNTTTDGLGASGLHIAAKYGAYEVLDVILDQEGVEIDQPEKREGDTCLHSAVRYVNALKPNEWEGEGKALVEILVDAGCDPRARNKARLRPADLLDPRNQVIKNVLQKAELQFMAGGDVVVEDDDDNRPNGPGSESD
jgi:ankyrin repeat protein